MSRDVRLVLCTADGDVLGALPRFEVATPWWMEVAPVIARAREQHAIDVTVLRLLETEEPWPPHGGAVTYLAETDARPNGLESVDIDVSDHPLRARWARPGGVRALVDWADGFVSRTGPPKQLRTWNLSLIVQLPTSDGPVWMKAVPPFFAHEPRVIPLVPSVGPELIAHGDGVLLLRDVPGPDRYAAPEPWMVERWVAVQHAWSADVAGLPDWREPSFIPLIERLVEGRDVEAVVTELPARFRALGECGLDDTIVHGDFHAGNWRGDTLIDWGDSGFGHPLLDQPAFGDVNAPWVETWKKLRPDSDPERAARLLMPIAALRQAHIYRMFLENIEPSEHCYHRNDTAEWLRKAVEARSRCTL